MASSASLPEKLRIGTRGSELALVQSRLTMEALRAEFPEIELEEIIISTTGDERQDLRLAQLTDEEGKALDKGVFTKELETALLEHKIDLAVHSAKDVPTELPPGLVLTNSLPRANTEDVLILSPDHELVKDLSDLPENCCIGTSSVRRAAILTWQDSIKGSKNLTTTDIRGNVPTRLRKLRDQTTLDGLILARAGLERLGHNPSSGRLELEDTSFPCWIIPDEIMLSAAGQGAVTWQTRAEDFTTQAACNAIGNLRCWLELRTERALLEKLQAGCQTPLSARAIFTEDKLSLRAWEFQEEKLGQAPRQAYAELAVNKDQELEKTINQLAQATASLLKV